MSTATIAGDVEMWDTIDVVLATKKGEEVMRALVHPRVPGLAVTMFHFGTFDVTHTASGKAVARGYERMGSACLALAALGRCADWTRDAAGIKAQIDEHGGEPADVPKWTVTQKGATRPQTKREIVKGMRDHDVMDEFPWESFEDDPMEQAGAILATLPKAPA